MPGDKVRLADSRFQEIDIGGGADGTGDSQLPRNFTEKKEQDVENLEPLSAADVAASVTDEATLFASPLPITGERKTTTRKELWVSLEDDSALECGRY